MKKIQFLFLLLVAGIFTTSCEDLDDQELPRNTAVLELTVKDVAGNVVPGTQVKLFASQDDWTNQTNQIGMTAISDDNGKVAFTGLTDVLYYFRAEKECLKNVNENHVTAAPLLLATTNVMEALVDGTGTLSLVVSRPGNYSVYIDGVYTFDISGGQTVNLTDLAADPHVVRVVETGGAFDESYDFLIECGQTTPVPVT